MNDHHIGEFLAGGAVVGTWMGYMPEVAALAATIFYVIRIAQILRGRNGGD